MRNSLITGAGGDTGSGIVTLTGGSFQLHHNTIRGFRFGIVLDGTMVQAGEVSGNAISQFTRAGIVVTGDLLAGQTIAGNVVDGGGVAGTTGISVAEGDSIVRGNLVRNTGQGIVLFATADEPLDNTVVEGNDLPDNGVGVVLDDRGGTIAGSRVTLNNITGAGAGLTSNSDETLDATCNWWGAASGPSGAGSGTGWVTSTSLPG